MFPVLLLHVPRGGRAYKPVNTREKVKMFFRTIRSNGLSTDQQRAAIRIHCDQTQNKELHDFTGEVFDGLLALYSTDEPSHG